MNAKSKVSAWGEFAKLILVLLNRGDQRSVLLKKDILLTILFQGGNLFLSFLLVPITLGYLNPMRYGIWVSLTAVLTWFSFFDLGIGNGLKQKLGEALAQDDKKLAKMYLSGAYLLFLGMAFFFVLVFATVSLVVPWSVLFQTPASMESELGVMVTYAVLFFLIRFALGPIQTLLAVKQQNAYNSGIQFAAGLLSLLLVKILLHITGESLGWLALAVSVPLPMALLVATAIIYTYYQPEIRPSFRQITLRMLKPLFGLGLHFFVIQIISLVIYTSDNIIILHFLGPIEVTPYALVYKYFSALSLFFGMAAAPLWTAFTNAHAKQDFPWIRAIIRKLIFFWIGVCVLSVLMIVLAPFIFTVWVGAKVQIPGLLTFLMGCFIMQNTWLTIFTYYINAIGKIRLQLYVQIFALLTNLLLSYFFVTKTNLGSSGVILATILCLLPQTVLMPLQYRRIINGDALGLWNK